MEVYWSVSLRTKTLVGWKSTLLCVWVSCSHLSPLTAGGGGWSGTLSFAGVLKGFSRWRRYSIVVMRQALESGNIAPVTQPCKTLFPHPRNGHNSAYLIGPLQELNKTNTCDILSISPVSRLALLLCLWGRECLVTWYGSLGRLSPTALTIKDLAIC